jgi:hypothetical protein
VPIETHCGLLILWAWSGQQLLQVSDFDNYICNNMRQCVNFSLPVANFSKSVVSIILPQEYFEPDEFVVHTTLELKLPVVFLFILCNVFLRFTGWTWEHWKARWGIHRWRSPSHITPTIVLHVSIIPWSFFFSTLADQKLYWRIHQKHREAWSIADAELHSFHRTNNKWCENSLWVLISFLSLSTI